MSNIKENVDQSSRFYSEQFLDFDYQLCYFNYLEFRKYFKGDIGLELGPAHGVMTKYLISDFEELHLIEGSKELIDKIPDYANVKKINSLFEDYETDLKYDTIIMGHVLEHIYNPVEVLLKIKTWLSDNGVFLISVPNAKSIHRMAAVEMGLLETVYTLNDRDRELGHYRVYDLDLLKLDIVKAGLRILDSGGIFLKPLSNKQIQDNWNEKMIEGFHKLGKYFPENCAEIFVACSK